MRRPSRLLAVLSGVVFLGLVKVLGAQGQNLVEFAARQVTSASAPLSKPLSIKHLCGAEAGI
jgi:hypothetical protein